LPNKYALIYPSAFAKPMLESLSKTIKLLKVCEEEAKKFACNAVCIEKTVIIPSGCPQNEISVE
jgi:N-dimethylarginine dimethylaminohydrolase